MHQKSTPEENEARGYPVPLWRTNVVHKGFQECDDVVACDTCGRDTLLSTDYDHVWPSNLERPTAFPGVVLCDNCHKKRITAGTVNEFPWAAYNAAPKVYSTRYSK